MEGGIHKAAVCENNLEMEILLPWWFGSGISGMDAAQWN